MKLKSTFTEGKTSLLERYTENSFSGEYKATIGVDFKTKLLTIDDTSVQLQIWDSAGQERFRTVNLGYAWMRGSEVFVIVVPLDSQPEEAIASLDNWFMSCGLVDLSHKVPYVVIGSKKDLLPSSDTMSATEKAVSDWAARDGYKYIATSAKNDEGVREAFETVANLGLRNVDSGFVHPPTACICLAPEQLEKQQNCGC